MNFGCVITGLKNSLKFARKGWSGKGMFIYLTTGTIIPVVNLKKETANNLLGEQHLECDMTIEIKSHIDMKAADGNVTVGWAPSQVDMLAEDWEVVE